ncbi:hypothetical protein PENTCL1PPCAC_27304, partial [Pristionchus entomophagus]
FLIQMRSLIVSFLAISFFDAVSSRNDFPNEVIVTSADLANGEIKDVGTAGEFYRLYAIYAGYINQDNTLTKQVTITDSKGAVFRLNEFHESGKVSYFLSDERIVVGPVTVHDPTSLSSQQKSIPIRLTYSIYLVSTKVPTLPVADAIEWSTRLTLNTDSYNGQEVKGVTILSADAFFTLRQFNFTSDSAFIIPRGYDLLSSEAKDSIIDLNQANADKSYITVFGPIATIVNSDPSKTGRFKLTYDVITTWGGISAGSSLTLLSPNWLSLDQSYSTSWGSYQEAFDRQFQYGKDTLLDLTISASSLKTGESITIEIKNEKGETNQLSYGPSDKGDKRETIYGTSLRLKANVANRAVPSTYPRFIVKVVSGISTTSMIIPLLLTVLNLLR